MSLAISAIICLILGLTSGELLSQINGKNMIIKEDSKKDLPERKLLYVVGVYPEWEERIVNFKKKWGEHGEIYHALPNVYTHGDIEELGTKNDAKRRIHSLEKMKKPTTLQESDTLEKEIKNSNEEEYNKDLLKKLNNINNSKTNIPIITKDDLPSIIMANFTSTRRNGKSRKEYESREKFFRKHFNVIEPNSMTNKNINNSIIIQEPYMSKSSSNLKNYDWNENDNERLRKKLVKFKKFYDNNEVRKSEEKINNEDDYRKYKNIDSTKVRTKKIGSDENDMSDTAVKKPVDTNEVVINYWPENKEKPESIIDDDTSDSKKYVVYADFKQKKKLPSPGNDTPKINKNQQIQDLKWIKKILIPQLYNHGRNEEIETHANSDDDISIEPQKEPYPISNKNILDDNTSETEEIKERNDVNSNFLANRKMLQHRVLNNQQHSENNNSNKKLADINKDAYKKV